jgi:nucleotide-binding universal stress UspA family protein
MADRVLVPFDGSPLSRRALDCAASWHPDAEVTVLYVIDPMDAVYEAEWKGLPAARTWHERARELADAACASASDRAAARGIDVETAVAVGRPSRAILRYVTDHDHDLVVMGSHGREGASRLVLGSVAERVLRRSPVPVTVVR